MIVPSISGYVLAGGRSSRMGRDKALLELAGKPLIAHAVTKLHRICGSVHILSANPELARYAPLVHDLHPETGPIGGIEAALAQTSTDWNLILPVDIPFIPTLFLERWLRTVSSRRRPTHVAFFSVFGVPQPTLLMVHRTAAPHLTIAIADGEYKLLHALEAAARELARPDAPGYEQGPYILPIDENMGFDGWEVPLPGPLPWQRLSRAQRAAQPLWFANLNTPEDFAEAERHTDALDT
jgi:molybdenum cofactor guanylyltransferase